MEIENIINQLPREIKSMVEGEKCVVDNIGQSGSTVLMFPDKVLKIQKETAETRSEYEMLRWLEGKLPVPRILCHVLEGQTSYMLMTRIEGQMACDEAYLNQPQVLIEVLAQSLKRLWEVDITGCPARWDLSVKLAAAEENVENDQVDLENVEPETFGENGFKNPRELLEWLKANQPREELVLSHGDFCLPNIFIKDGQLSGYIDLGRMGVADKWQDIALCYRSLMHNYSGKYATKVRADVNPDLLFEALGIEPDWEKLRYYILMDELF